MYNSKRKTKNLLSSGTRQKFPSSSSSHSFSDVPRFVSHVLCCLVCSVIFLLKSCCSIVTGLEKFLKNIFQLLLLACYRSKQRKKNLNYLFFKNILNGRSGSKWEVLLEPLLIIFALSAIEWNFK